MCGPKIICCEQASLVTFRSIFGQCAANIAATCALRPGGAATQPAFRPPTHSSSAGTRSNMRFGANKAGCTVLDPTARKKSGMSKKAAAPGAPYGWNYKGEPYEGESGLTRPSLTQRLSLTAPLSCILSHAATPFFNNNPPPPPPRQAPRTVSRPTRRPTPPSRRATAARPPTPRRSSP